MSNLFKLLRIKYLNNDNIGKYLLYAIGEVILITIGVLIAININKSVNENKERNIRCQYLDELNFTIEFDMKDIESNISAIDERQPKLKELGTAIQEGKLEELDSLDSKIGVLRQFVYFGQRTKTKMDELKNSNIDLVGNRDLKNKLLLYQDEQIEFLQNMEYRFSFLEEEVRKYYSVNIIGNQNYLDKIKNDQQFKSLIYQKYSQNKNLKFNYESILEKQEEIKSLLLAEIIKNCIN